MTKKIDDIIIFIWLYIIVALPPMAILYFFSDYDAMSLDFFTLLTISIVLPAIGSILSIWRKKIPQVFFLHLDKRGKLNIIIVAIFLSIILWKFYSILSFFNYFGVIILFLFFLSYLPISIEYLNSIDFNKIKLFIIPFKGISKINVIERILYIIVALLLIHTSIIAIDYKVRAYKHYQIFLSRHPKIKDINPKIVYYSNMVVLNGREFGWKKNADIKLKYNNGNINTFLWTDTKIAFTVPLHWKEGDVNIWIEKPMEWDGENVILKSNVVKLNLISRDDGWGKEDDEYFEQLKHLDKETLKLNGY